MHSREKKSFNLAVQVLSTWLILAVFTGLFVLIALLISSILKDQNIIIILSFLVVAPIMLAFQLRGRSFFKVRGARTNILEVLRGFRIIFHGNQLSVSFILAFLIVFTFETLWYRLVQTYTPTVLFPTRTMPENHYNEPLQSRWTLIPNTYTTRIPNVLVATGTTTGVPITPTPILMATAGDWVASVETDALYIHSSPGVDKPRIGKLFRGTLVEVEALSQIEIGPSTWVYVTTEQGQKGWVNSNFLSSPR